MSSAVSGRRSIPPTGTGREELRTTLLRPFLLRLHDERGEAAVRNLFLRANLSQRIFEDDTTWVSIASARRVLEMLVAELGPEALEKRGAWATHPETLGAYVRLLRAANSPEEAYRYLSANASESMRTGTYKVENAGPGRMDIIYHPRPDCETEQNDPLLCALRRAELVSVPRIWGFEDAELQHPICICRKGHECRYRLRWQHPNPLRALIGFGAGASVGSGFGLIAGSGLFTAIGALIGGCLGGAINLLMARLHQERAARVFERNRIAALERGLAVRGELLEAAQDLTNLTLGGKYRILSRIGSGGIGAVYAAEHLGLGSKVAIKVLRGAAAMDASEIARLRREARIQGSIESSHVVRTLDLDQMPDGSIFVVMELLHGISLATKIKTQGPLTPDEAVALFSQVCRGLHAAHHLGIIHRDLKPGNIFLCEDRSVKVLDFGMSKLLGAESLTQEGYTLGTPEYMSPEQCIGAPVDSRTDLYSLGVVMYEALTGEIPIKTLNRREFLELHQRQIPQSLCEFQPELGIPPELDTAVMACLKKRAAERPASARELEKMLLAVPACSEPSSGTIGHSQPPSSGLARRSG